MLQRIVSVAVITMAVCAAGLAQQADTRTGPRRKAPAVPGSLAENQVLQVEHDWVEAYLKHDIAALENVLADDWTYSPADGSFKTRTQVIEDFRVDTMKYESISQSSVKVRVYGNTAVVTGDELIKGSDGGKQVSSHLRITDVFVKRNDRWQAVASHETTIVEPVESPTAPGAAL